jgi:hypothetical protein
MELACNTIRLCDGLPRSSSCRIPSRLDEAIHSQGVNLACNTLPYKIAALRDAHPVCGVGTVQQGCGAAVRAAPISGAQNAGAVTADESAESHQNTCVCRCRAPSKDAWPTARCWDDLRCFLELARSARLTIAGRRLGVEHTTVARRLRALEAAAGQPLFLRASTGYELADGGRKLLPTAEAMEQAYAGGHRASIPCCPPADAPVQHHCRTVVGAPPVSRLAGSGWCGPAPGDQDRESG